MLLPAALEALMLLPATPEARMSLPELQQISEPWLNLL